MILERIHSIITRLNLDLTGKVVLTEIGSGHFAYVGLIAAAAKAKKVILWSKDSVYGKAEENLAYFKELLGSFEIKATFEISLNERNWEQVAEADIITNSGFIRPIDEKFVRHLKAAAVITYMAESWEFRKTDIDLIACKQRGIKVGGTWENHPDLLVLEQCGELALKMISDANCSIENKEVLLISADEFGNIIKRSLTKNPTTAVTLMAPLDLRLVEPAHFDLIFIANYASEDQVIGNDGLLKLEENCEIPIVHLAGVVDIDFANAKGYIVSPNMQGDHHRMTQTLAYLGDEPVIKLHAAGLKVGELMCNNQKNELIQWICP